MTPTNPGDNNVRNVKPSHIERLRLPLNFTPNVHFDRRPDKDSVVPVTHALHSTTRTQKAKSVADLARNNPADKPEKLGAMLAELNKDD